MKWQCFSMDSSDDDSGFDHVTHDYDPQMDPGTQFAEDETGIHYYDHPPKLTMSKAGKKWIIRFAIAIVLFTMWVVAKGM